MAAGEKNGEENLSGPEKYTEKLQKQQQLLHIQNEQLPYIALR